MLRDGRRISVSGIGRPAGVVCQAGVVQPEHEIERVDLDGLSLTHGDAVSLEVPATIGPITLGGQEYSPQPESPLAKLDVSRTSAGYALRLRFEVEMAGPCFRCLEPAANRVRIDVREVDQPVDATVVEVPGARPGDTTEDEEGEDASAAELESPYVEAGHLDLSGWARDALILALPTQILCRDDCLGLCSFCGESLNGADPKAHDHGQNQDPRWAKLRDLT